MGRHSAAPSTSGTARRRLPLLAVTAAALLTVGGAHAGAFGSPSTTSAVRVAAPAITVASVTASSPSNSPSPRTTPTRLSRAQRTLPAKDVPSPPGARRASPTPTPPEGAAPTDPQSTATPTATGTVPGKWVRPNDGPYNSCYCMRWGAMHNGIDLAGKLGSPIYAAGDGVVLDAGPAQGFGNWIVIQHANGDVTIYGHMRYYSVHAGDRVTAGQQIAVVGAEGDVTGPHLHFGVRLGSPNGPYTDPVPWLAARGVAVGPYEPGA